MSCEICGRSSCTRSFHSIEEQENFDSIADGIKDRMREYLTHRVSRLEGHFHGNNYYINLEKVINIIEDY